MEYNPHSKFMCGIETNRMWNCFHSNFESIVLHTIKSRATGINFKFEWQFKPTVLGMGSRSCLQLFASLFGREPKPTFKVGLEISTHSCFAHGIIYFLFTGACVCVVICRCLRTSMRSATVVWSHAVN